MTKLKKLGLLASSVLSPVVAIALPMSVSAQTLPQFPSTGTAVDQGEWFLSVINSVLGSILTAAGQFIIDHILAFIVLSLGLVFARGMIRKFFAWLRSLFSRT